MAIVRYLWASCGADSRAWFEWDNVRQELRAILVLNTSGHAIRYKISDSLNGATLIEGFVQSQPTEQVFDIPRSQRRHPDEVNLEYWC